MILISLIKKEVLHFFRNKSNVATMFIFPIVLIVVMGFSLNGLMNVDHNIFENEKVYFKVNNINKDNRYLQVFNSFKENCESNMKIEFEEVLDDNEAESNVNSFQGLAFINIYEDKYDFYRNKDKESTAQKIFKSVFNQYLDRYALIDSVVSENPNILNDIVKEVSNTIVKEEGISSNGINSFTYYTFAELVLIILYISQITSVSAYNERVENTLSRLKISKVNNFSIILSKITLGITVGIIQIIIVYFVSNVFLNINWGENLVIMLMVLISLIIFSSILGVTISFIFKDNKAASSVINTLLIVLGFLGGAYVPISLIRANEVTNMLCQITPTYWANISLLSLSSGITTNYSTVSIVLSLELSLILLVICIVSSNMRVGDNIV
ncbi:ABC transporter permease [Clostridium sp. D53t1_180928_C8]|uniref:ABC transporter permease n=1 Tax=Clostridium sp. D53t1_180928_C8 TaxID=2787101 RepID=UPI0018AA7DA2|nr:ABC transporter permease [Clostridium sp. D53t1_180928_C8]